MVLELDNSNWYRYKILLKEEDPLRIESFLNLYKLAK
jgi:hypothetical protein